MAFTTRKSLLAKVRAGDEVSWREFYTAYKPLIFLCGGDCGLSKNEQEELLQNVMCEIFQKDVIGKFDPDNLPPDLLFKYDVSKGRFRHYLRSVARHHAMKIYHNRKKRDQVEVKNPDEDTVESVASPEKWDEVWDEDWRHHVLNMALFELKSQVKPETYAAFELYALQQRDVTEVANFLNLSVSSVYVAKSRCISILKKIIENLEDK